MIGYVTLGSNDIPRTGAFYDAMLGEIGAKRQMDSESFIAWSITPGTPMLGVKIISPLSMLLLLVLLSIISPNHCLVIDDEFFKKHNYYAIPLYKKHKDKDNISLKKEKTWIRGEFNRLAGV